MSIITWANIYSTINGNIYVCYSIFYWGVCCFCIVLFACLYSYAFGRIILESVFELVCFCVIFRFVSTYVLPGLRVVAVAVILQAFVALFKKVTTQYIMVAIVFASAAAYYFKPTTPVILI